MTLSHLPGRDGGRIARLYLNDTEVGVVSVLGHTGSWGFGEFTASAGFAEFAPVFARWSLLMHAEDASDRLNESVSQRLRASEYEMDAIRASLLIEQPEERHQLRQLNIDGGLIEWKE